MWWIRLDNPALKPLFARKQLDCCVYDSRWVRACVQGGNEKAWFVLMKCLVLGLQSAEQTASSSTLGYTGEATLVGQPTHPHIELHILRH